MKKYIPYSLIFATAASGMAFGAATAYTTPVGYVTLNVPSKSDTTVVPPLQRPTTFVGISTSISSNDIGASGITSGAFVAPNPGSYFKVTSGPLAGRQFEITANSGTTITVAGGATTLQAQGFVTGNTFMVVPYWTLNTMFPAGAGVGTTSDVTNATSFVFGASTGVGINKASTVTYIYCTGDTGNGLPAGWYNNDDVFAGPLPEAATRLDPFRMYTIRTSSNTNLSVVVSGEVPGNVTTIPVAVSTAFNDVYLGAPYPVDISLTASGLQSAIQASPDATNPVELVFVYNNDGSGINKAIAKAYFFCSGDTANGLPAGWYDNDDVFAGPVLNTVTQIKAGRGVVIRKAPYMSAGSVSWTAPVPYAL